MTKNANIPVFWAPLCQFLLGRTLHSPCQAHHLDIIVQFTCDISQVPIRQLMFFQGLKLTLSSLMAVLLWLISILWPLHRLQTKTSCACSPRLQSEPLSISDHFVWHFSFRRPSYPIASVLRSNSWLPVTSGLAPRLIRESGLTHTFSVRSPVSHCHTTRDVRHTWCWNWSCAHRHRWPSEGSHTFPVHWLFHTVRSHTLHRYSRSSCTGFCAKAELLVSGCHHWQTSVLWAELTCLLGIKQIHNGLLEGPLNLKNPLDFWPLNNLTSHSGANCTQGGYLLHCRKTHNIWDYAPPPGEFFFPRHMRMLSHWSICMFPSWNPPRSNCTPRPPSHPSDPLMWAQHCLDIGTLYQTLTSLFMCVTTFTSHFSSTICCYFSTSSLIFCLVNLTRRTWPILNKGVSS